MRKKYNRKEIREASKVQNVNSRSPSTHSETIKLVTTTREERSRVDKRKLIEKRVRNALLSIS